MDIRACFAAAAKIGNPRAPIDTIFSLMVMQKKLIDHSSTGVAPPLTLDQYKSEVVRHDKALVVRMVVSVGMMFAALGVAGVIRAYDAARADVLAPIVMFLVGAPLMIYGFHLSDRTYRKFPSLVCPHCDGSLSRARATVIATGNCPNCGRSVLKDDRIGT